MAKTSYITEGLAAAAAFRTAMVETFYTQEQWPTDNASAGLLEPTAYKSAAVTQITIRRTEDKGMIIIQYSSRVDPFNNTLMLIAGGAPNQPVQWTCQAPKHGGVENRLLPAQCQRSPAK